MQAPVCHCPSRLSCSRYNTPCCLCGPLGSGSWLFKPLVRVSICRTPDPLALPDLGAHLLCKSTRAPHVCHLDTHGPLSGFCLFLPEGLGEGEPHGVGGRAVGFFLVIGHLLPASPGVFGACLHKVDAGCNSVMNSMNTNLLLPLTLGSPKDQNQTI